MADQIRVATFNASLNRTERGELIADLSDGSDTQARNVAEIIQKTNADIILINEFDYYGRGEAARLFQENYLGVSQNGAKPIDYKYVYAAPSNTGVLSGFDLDNNGIVATRDDIGTATYAGDSYGFGNFRGQYGFVIYSKHPIVEDEIRTFQDFKWKDMPGNLLTDDPTANPLDDYYAPDEIDALRLSSKNHVDVPIRVDGEIVHVLASHPTPPTFDGAEDRNGKRNHDEIRFWKDYVDNRDYIYDDAGKHGGLKNGERFVILGDQNADPFDGDSYDNAIRQLLRHESIIGSAREPSITPEGPGGREQAVEQGGPNLDHRGNPAFDTADFGFNPADPTTDVAPGNLRADYVLPSRDGFAYLDGHIFWPQSSDPDYDLAAFPTSDHRLVAVDLRLTDDDRRTVSGAEFLGATGFRTGLEFKGTEVGGLSGISYDPLTKSYVAISDDRSQIDPARFYTLDIDLSDGRLDRGDVAFTDVTTLTRRNGEPFKPTTVDPEGIAVGPSGIVFVSSEGDQTQGIAPFVRVFDARGNAIGHLDVDDKFLPTSGPSGIRNNLAFESLTLSPDQQTLFTATENALFQDGPAATLANGSVSRIVQYDLVTGEAVAEYGYLVDPVPEEPDPAGAFSTNGLVELIALDNDGTLLALERGFSTGVGNTIRLYEVRTQGATNLIGTDAIPTEIDDGELVANVDALVSKELLVDFADYGIRLDNVEGMTLGPVLADGRQTLTLVADNNFSATQRTQVITLALDIDKVPTLHAVAETPDEVRYEDGILTDPDDPAIWSNPYNPDENVVITAMKNGGARVYDLEGNELQRIVPDDPEDLRYNNVDLVYGVDLGDRTRDLAVFSDRANDTLAFYSIDRHGRLHDRTAADVPDTIFGRDDGERTAYGLATYRSVVDGKEYVYVTQADGAKIAQLEVIAHDDGTVGYEKVRTLNIPVPAGEERADYQSEGIAIDRETGIGYVAVEDKALYSFNAEADGSGRLRTVVEVGEDNLEADIEGVSIYYGKDGTGMILLSSQGDSTFAAFDRQTREYLGAFAIGDADGVDGVQESDGADIYSGTLPGFRHGLLVTQDGSNDPAVVFPDPEDGEIQNFNANFKYTDLRDVLRLFDIAPNPDFDPRTLGLVADADLLN